MPSLSDSLRQGVVDMSNTAPAMRITSAIGKVGEVAQDAYRKAKSYMPDRPSAPAPRGDIKLPADRRKASREPPSTDRKSSR